MIDLLLQVVSILSLSGPVRLCSQQPVASTDHAYPSAAGKQALIELPPLDQCANSDDVAFLKKHETRGDVFKIYFYAILALAAGQLPYTCQFWQLVEFRPLYNRRGKQAVDLKF